MAAQIRMATHRVLFSTISQNFYRCLHPEGGAGSVAGLPRELQGGASSVSQVTALQLIEGLTLGWGQVMGAQGEQSGCGQGWLAGSRQFSAPQGHFPELVSSSTEHGVLTQIQGSTSMSGYGWTSLSTTPPLLPSTFFLFVWRQNLMYIS